MSQKKLFSPEKKISLKNSPHNKSRNLFTQKTVMVEIMTVLTLVLMTLVIVTVVIVTVVTVVIVTEVTVVIVTVVIMTVVIFTYISKNNLSPLHLYDVFRAAFGNLTMFSSVLGSNRPNTTKFA